MAAYDSDSSGELDDFTETTTLLGYASKDRTDDTFSQLGGLPVRNYHTFIHCEKLTKV